MTWMNSRVLDFWLRSYGARVPVLWAMNVRIKMPVTVLVAAALRYGLPEVCSALLARADFTEINAKTNDGETALHIAAR